MASTHRPVDPTGLPPRLPPPPLRCRPRALRRTAAMLLASSRALCRASGPGAPRRARPIARRGGAEGLQQQEARARLASAALAAALALAPAALARDIEEVRQHHTHLPACIRIPTCRGSPRESLPCWGLWVSRGSLSGQPAVHASGINLGTMTVPIAIGHMVASTLTHGAAAPTDAMGPAGAETSSRPLGWRVNDCGVVRVARARLTPRPPPTGAAEPERLAPLRRGAAGRVQVRGSR